MANKSKIYLLVAGQTDELQRKDWLSFMPELGIIADVEMITIFDQPSADITPDIWLKLAQAIHGRADKAKGFVIMHGVDNLLFTSSVLSFLLANLGKPIIFTGPYPQKKLEVRANLINAVQAASYNYSEVGLMFGNRLLRANQAVQLKDESLNMFTAPASAVLGRIDFSIRIFEKVAIQVKGKMKFTNQLNNKIEILNILPTLNLKNLAKHLADRDGIILNANDYQDIPQDLMLLLQKVSADLPVVVWTRQISKLVLAPKNLILVNNMTWEATIAKFMWALPQIKNIKQLKELMSRNIAGEIIV